MRHLLAILIFVLVSAHGATILVANYGDGSGSAANFQSAYNAASAGDTIQFPIGTNTWASSITVSKGVSILGAGTNQTRLNAADGLTTSFFIISGFTYTPLLRIRGICFDMVDVTNTTRFAINISNVTLDNLRIDHNEFHFGYQGLEIGGCKGVIDHNAFYNCLKGISFTAGSNTQASNSWNDMSMGTGNALFIEDNSFIDDANYKGAAGQERIGTYNGGKLVIRYNLFDSTNIATAFQMYAIMTHGSAAGGVANGYWQLGTGARRGQSTVEIYHNNIGGKRVDYLFAIRGSANLIYSNILDTQTFTPSAYAYEEEQYEPQWNPLRTVWPAEDQVHNTFIWGNTLRLNGITNDNYFSISLSSTDFIQENRDYWLHAPQASGGYEYFTGANGASSSYPTDGDTYPTLGTMVFSATGPNAYYGYRPYYYPHPLNVPEYAPTSFRFK